MATYFPSFTPDGMAQFSNQLEFSYQNSLLESAMGAGTESIEAFPDGKVVFYGSDGNPEWVFQQGKLKT